MPDALEFASLFSQFDLKNIYSDKLLNLFISFLIFNFLNGKKIMDKCACYSSTNRLI